jgi:molybdate transport system substrate-binding protein
MNNRRHTPIKLASVIAAVFLVPSASVAQVKVIMSGRFSASLQELLPEFEKTAGITVTTARGAQGNGPNTIGSQLRGIAADVLIMSR